MWLFFTFVFQYLAPEVLQKLPYTRSIDWWCLGAVTYEMVYGLPPFYSRNTDEMYQGILYKPLRLNSSVSYVPFVIFGCLCDSSFKAWHARLPHTDATEKPKASSRPHGRRLGASESTQVLPRDQFRSPSLQKNSPCLHPKRGTCIFRRVVHHGDNLHTGNSTWSHKTGSNALLNGAVRSFWTYGTWRVTWW